MRESPRIRRLRSDLKVLERLRDESTILDFNAHGNPPEGYVITFLGRGLSRSRVGHRIAIRDRHEVAIRLGASYPRVMPEMEWRSPIFHPNISESGVVCLGGYGTYWVPSLNLDELCEMLWDMVRFQNYDPASPYNRDAARWVETQREFVLPVDSRPIRDKLSPESPPVYEEESIVEAEVVFIDDAENGLMEAEVVEPEDPDILIIE